MPHRGNAWNKNGLKSNLHPLPVERVALPLHRVSEEGAGEPRPHGRYLRERLQVSHVVLEGDLHAPVHAHVLDAAVNDLVPLHQWRERRGVRIGEVATARELVPLGRAERVGFDAGGLCQGYAVTSNRQ